MIISSKGVEIGNMRHEKEWHTCDRCGAEIEDENRSELSKKWYRIRGLITKKSVLFKSVDFDLCPKCSKDFERFMRNGKSTDNG